MLTCEQLWSFVFVKKVKSKSSKPETCKTLLGEGEPKEALSASRGLLRIGRNDHGNTSLAAALFPSSTNVESLVQCTTEDSTTRLRS
jgi:hypothetical protein